ncbi:DUF1801 domain-containing protein [Kriegella aquimaris]|uniref:Uncharacterized conserved protein YdeI, YjbR/CyaY-like superfamily, DUF1801 family n=1 Tax=Kriegella aquimaris TaxID=192904 RepID=A0A1G9SWY5_9FLAO|nr:DUF1801 domain-containing protein [Kriegella aquimaris]SDM39913.1 Uncharacterized conserved protein YdeI, YjbR/CyaY-like superfamily, DUF1801 family [Kriegella aquimaris]
MNETNPKVDEYFKAASKWREELQQLRTILIDCNLTEELKWRTPCYTFKQHNIALLGSFKAYFSLSFFKGVLLKDVHGLLVAPGENSQSVRMLKFTDVQEIVTAEPLIKAYIYEAIEIERAGLKVNLKQSTNLVFPEEFQQKLDESPTLKSAFEALTPGRQRAYNLFFSAPKQSKTRVARVEKYRKRILDGIGINDCTCGQSKKLPQCDGSHKYI